MSIEITEATLGMWSVFFKNGNWLAHLSRTEDGHHVLAYRFRWYRDELIGRDSKDVRHFYRGALKAIHTDRAALEAARDIFETVATHLPGVQGSWELIKGARSVEEFLHALGGMAGIHVGEPESTVPIHEVHA